MAPLSKVFWIALTTLLASTGSAQLEKLWQDRVEYQGNNDTASHVQVDHAGNSYVTGRTVSVSASTVDILVAKYSPTGKRIWLRKFGTAGLRSQATETALDSEGNLVLSGHVLDPSTNYSDMLIMKIGTGGTQLWRRTFNSGKDTTDQAYSIAVDEANNVIVAGSCHASNGSSMTTLKFSPTGVRLWFRHYGGPYTWEQGQKVRTDAAGNIVVTGSIHGQNSDFDVITAKYDPAGNLLWQARYDGPYGMNDQPSALQLDAAGSPIVLMRTDTWVGTDLVLVKYSTSGTQLWLRISPEAISGGVLSVDAAKNVILATQISGASMDILIQKYRPGGSLFWSKTYDSPYAAADRPIAVDVDPLGNIYVAGSSNRTEAIESMDYLTLKLSAAGTIEWAERYNSESDLQDVATAVRVAPDGNVIVTGSSYLASIDLPADPDFYTIKYKVTP